MNAPRTLVKINGQVVKPISWKADLNGHGAIDTATIVVPIKGNPDWPLHNISTGFQAYFKKYNPGSWDPVDAQGYSGGYNLYGAYLAGLIPDSAGHLPDQTPSGQTLKSDLDTNAITAGIDNRTGYQVAPATYTGPMTASIIQNAPQYFHAGTAYRPGGPGGWDDVPAGKRAPALVPPPGYVLTASLPFVPIVTGTQTEVRIAAGFPPNPNANVTYESLVERFVGTADAFSPAFDLSAQTCTISCRSFGAVLVDTKTTTNLGGVGVANLQNISTVQYIQRVAVAHGFTTDIQVKAPASLQTVYATQQLVGIHNMRIWDIFMACAEVDGTYLWVDGKTIHYVDPVLLSNSRPIMPLAYGDPQNPGVMTLSGNHSRLNKNIRVEVRSYRPEERIAHRSQTRGVNDASGNISAVVTDSTTVGVTDANFGNPGNSVTTTRTTRKSGGATTVESGSGSSLSIGGETSSGYLSTPNDSSLEHYVYKYPNLTQAQCDARALSLWTQLSAQEYRATISFAITPENLKLFNVTTKYRVTNLPWASFTQDYIALRLTESFDMGGAWKASAIGINHRIPTGLGNE